MTTDRLPRCDFHDLERLWCPEDCPHYGNSFTMTPAEQALVTWHRTTGGVTHIRDIEHTTRRRLHEFRFTPRAGEQWHQPQPEARACHGHERPPGAQLCPTCHDHLERLLGDVPAIVEALQTAHTKDTRFPALGHKRHDPEQAADESPIPVNLGASRVLADLTATLGGDPVRASRYWLTYPTRNRLANAMLRDLSRAMRRAHHVIDRPEDLVYVGNCQCGRELHTPRGHTILCDCGYHAEWQAHLDQILADRLDTLMTVSELTTATGLDRGRVKNLTRRMTGTKVARPHLSGWVISSEEVEMYRLGDVIAEHERRQEKAPA